TGSGVPIERLVVYRIDTGVHSSPPPAGEPPPDRLRTRMGQGLLAGDHPELRSSQLGEVHTLHPVAPAPPLCRLSTGPGSLHHYYANPPAPARTPSHLVSDLAVAMTPARSLTRRRMLCRGRAFI